jgi:hypothetical protein
MLLVHTAVNPEGIVERLREKQDGRYGEELGLI